MHVHNKETNINTYGGSDNIVCCVDGLRRMCVNMYFTALLNMTSNTVINITSESVALEEVTSKWNQVIGTTSL